MLNSFKENKNKYLWFIGGLLTIAYCLFYPKLPFFMTTSPFAFILGIFFHLVLPVSILFFTTPKYSFGIRPLLIVTGVFLFLYFKITIDKQLQGSEYYLMLKDASLNQIESNRFHLNFIFYVGSIFSVVTVILGSGLPFLPFYKKEEATPIEVTEINCPRCGQKLSSLSFYCHKCKLPLK